jgi:hypothetical protein
MEPNLEGRHGDMASRIYIVTDRALKTDVRWVRAGSLNAAVRAVAKELFDARPASTDEVYRAMARGCQVLDAQTDAPDLAAVDAEDRADAGPVPLRVAG